MQHSKISGFKWWQFAIGAVVVSFIGGLSSMQSGRKDRKLYNKRLKQAPWAPPAWLFAPAWTLNNFFLLIALHKLVKGNHPDRRKLLVLQGMIWQIFFSFNYIYFNKKSTVLAAILTKTDAALALASLIISARADKRLAACYLPLLTWTGFASTLADYQALKNPDVFLKLKPLQSYLPGSVQRMIPA